MPFILITLPKQLAPTAKRFAPVNSFFARGKSHSIRLQGNSSPGTLPLKRGRFSIICERY